MEEWKEYKLGEIAEFKTGKLNSNAAVQNGKYPFFTCAPETYYIDDYAFDQKAIILAGNNAEGNFSIKYYEGKFNAYQRTYVINPISDVVDIRFLYYALQLCLQQFKTLSQGTSTKFLTAKILNAFCIQVPSLAIQKRIAGIIKSLDDKIEVNRRINDNFYYAFFEVMLIWLLTSLENDNLEKQAQSLFKAWFVDFEPFACGEFVESELGLIPKDWKVVSLSDTADYINGLAMQKYRPTGGESGLPVLKIKELGQGRTDDSSELCSPSLIGNKYIIDDGDIIFSWSGTLMVKVWCGGKCGLNQHLFVVKPNNYPDWFAYQWTKHHLDNFIHIAKDKAVTMGHIKRGELDKAKVVVPDETNMAAIDLLMKPLHDHIITNMKEVRRLSSLRDTLLPRLMSGELKVNEIENVI